jgi:hypothetical protein
VLQIRLGLACHELLDPLVLCPINRHVDDALGVLRRERDFVGTGAHLDRGSQSRNDRNKRRNSSVRAYRHANLPCSWSPDACGRQRGDALNSNRPKLVYQSPSSQKTLITPDGHGIAVSLIAPRSNTGLAEAENS